MLIVWQGHTYSNVSLTFLVTAGDVFKRNLHVCDVIFWNKKLIKCVYSYSQCRVVALHNANYEKSSFIVSYYEYLIFSMPMKVIYICFYAFKYILWVGQPLLINLWQTNITLLDIHLATTTYLFTQLETTIKLSKGRQLTYQK